MPSLYLDFETFWTTEYSLRKLTPPEYIFDPRFEVIVCSVLDPEWKPARPRTLMPADMPVFLGHYDPAKTMACSHNALFDLSILAWRYHWTPALMQDTLGLARALFHHKFRRFSLGELSKHLGLGVKKDTIFKVKGLHAPEIKAKGLWEEYCAYSRNDVLLCCKLYNILAPQLPKEELKLMDLVLRCAVQPVFKVDTELLNGYLSDLRKIKEELLQRSGYDRASLLSTDKFKAVLEDLGVAVETKKSKTTGKDIPAFAKTDSFMEALQSHEDYHVQAVAAARLSQRSTIDETRAQKFLSISSLPWANGGRLLPVALRYGGAHTHRLSGEWKINLQNLPRDASKSKLRHALIAPPNHWVVSVDLSQIEARLVAWLAGCTELLEQFRRKEDPYAVLASRIFHYQVNKADYPVERFIGKTGILGLGYGCGVERFYAMVLSQARQAGLDLGNKFTYMIADLTVETYRLVYWEIPALWHQLDRWLPTLNQGRERGIPFGPRGWREDHDNGGLRVYNKRDLIVIEKGAILLPNGMSLRYNVPDIKLYGAKLLENIIQALARIVVMQAALRLNKLGYRFALQAHDELAFVVSDDQLDTAKETILAEMIRPPVWAIDLPLAAEIGHGRSYGDTK
jgi:DNA polymerase